MISTYSRWILIAGSCLEHRYAYKHLHEVDWGRSNGSFYSQYEIQCARELNNI